MNDLISTKEAMKILGVGPTTIKRWANEKVLNSTRTAGGHRRFERHEVEQLRVQQSGLPASTAPRDAWMVLLMRHSNPGEISDRIAALHDELGSWLEVADFLGGVAEHIGTEWASGDCSVIEEHIATSRLYSAVRAVAEAFEVPDDAPVCALATLSGEQHALGIALAELCVRSEGLNTVWIGVDTPVDLLVSHLRDADYQMVALSASRWSTDYGSLANAYADIAAVCKKKGTELILGGAGAWPGIADYGYRCYSFAGLRNVLDCMDRSEYPPNS